MIEPLSEKQVGTVSATIRRDALGGCQIKPRTSGWVSVRGQKIFRKAVIFNATNIRCTLTTMESGQNAITK
jgi:hypothetical protein